MCDSECGDLEKPKRKGQGQSPLPSESGVTSWRLASSPPQAACASFMKERISSQIECGPNTQQEEFWKVLLLCAPHKEDSTRTHSGWLLHSRARFPAHTQPNLKGWSPGSWYICTERNKPAAMRQT